MGQASHFELKTGSYGLARSIAADRAPVNPQSRPGLGAQMRSILTLGGVDGETG